MIRVLDTNVLLEGTIQETIRSFEPCEIVIPLAVIQELDTFKKLDDNRGRNAREAIRFLDGLRQCGKLHDGVDIGNGYIVRVEVNCTSVELPQGLDKRLPDTRILMVAKELSLKDDVVLVTQDICERVVADTIDIKAEDYLATSIDIDDIYSGWKVIEITDEEVQEWYENKKIRTKRKLVPNQYLVMKDSAGGERVGRYDGLAKCIVEVKRFEAWGIKPAKGNLEQRFLLDLLLNDDVNLVTALGPAGTGKTLLAIAAGLQKTLEEEVYKKIIVSRAIIPVGNDIGYLPGNKEEKLTPWMGAIFDNLEYLARDMASCKYDNRKSTPAERVDEMIGTGILELEALTYIRGRSIPYQWIIIDEGQNISKNQMKTIISRAGEGTKIVITGDIEQIDNHRISSSSNGLVHIIEAFKGWEHYGHITLKTTERSKLAAEAVKRL